MNIFPRSQSTSFKASVMTSQKQDLLQQLSLLTFPVVSNPWLLGFQPTSPHKVQFTVPSQGKQHPRYHPLCDLSPTRMSKTMTFKTTPSSFILKETPLFSFLTSAPSFAKARFFITVVPNLFGFYGRHIFHALGGGDSFGMIQAQDTHWVISLQHMTSAPPQMVRP